jgi:hypothetical protein
VLLGLLLSLKLDVEHLAEVLTQAVRGGALDAAPGFRDESLQEQIPLSAGHHNGNKGLCLQMTVPYHNFYTIQAFCARFMCGQRYAYMLPDNTHIIACLHTFHVHLFTLYGLLNP